MSRNRSTQAAVVARMGRLGPALCGAALLWALPGLAQAQPRPHGVVAIKIGNKCLDLNGPQVRANGGRVQLWDCHGGPNQQWRIEGSGRVVSMASGRCLDVHGPDIGFNGARVQVWDCSGGPNQQWRFDNGHLVEQVDGRCLDVYGPDMGRNGGHVQTWDCHRGPNQQFFIERLGGGPWGPPGPPPPQPVMTPPPGPPPGVRSIEAGPLWNQRDAERKCPSVCAPGAWTGQWRTTIPGQMSVCECGPGQVVVVPPPQPVVVVPPPQPVVVAPQGPAPIDPGRFEAVVRAMRAEAFSEGKLRVLEGVARTDYFLVAQLRRVIENLTFSADKIRAVQLIAPHLLDRENVFSLYSVFTFSSDKEQARQILEGPR